MSLFQNFRLGLVHLSVTLTFVPVTGVLNRVMIHEFEILASTVALLTVMPYLFSPLQVFIGRYADTHPIAGRRRTPYALAGILLCIGGLQLTPFAAIAIADSAPFAPLLAGAGFGLWGIGYNLAVVSYLSLASELSTPAERPRVVSVMWVMMVLGSIAAAVLIGRALAPYSNTALIGVFQSVGLVSLGCAAIGLWRLEPKAKTAQTRTEVRWSPSEVLATLAKKPEVRIFFIYLVLMLASILGQDVLLEPFAARAFAMSVKDTTHLTAIWGVATLAAMLLYGFLLNRFFSRKQGAQIGLALAACGLLLIAASGLLGLKAAFFIGLATLGLGTGIATATNLALMLGMTPEGQTGVYMGAWGIADALSRALGNFLSGVWRDAMTYLSGNPLVGYVSVFLTQVLLLGVSLWLLQKISEETATPKREDLAESIAIVAEGSN
ncbi:MAG: BCD family MFS transporter [Chloroherpetonaceae bacterium]|nr:BCD family MFS transporter [Chloroherpetonaceae bacterium]MCS7211957.1 BCD family MFS transporter [Chloroherpetonaceae bacterium]MDW8020905.1 BCD family MFS transporter [Chloroherpetonaceae bacterium]MDW8466159.1 BCD family MFS transporter [Chloroherpetonaceae bacterium]